jgi:hypothetical protein
MPTDNIKKGRGGARPNSGRPKKPNPEDYIQVTCVLRRDTVEKLKEGAGGKQKFFGGFLQFHLDRFPIPTHEEYMAMRNRKPSFAVVARRRTPVIYGGNVARARRAASRPGPRRRPSEQDAIRRKFLREFEPIKVA